MIERYSGCVLMRGITEKMNKDNVGVSWKDIRILWFITVVVCIVMGVLLYLLEG